MKKLTLIFPLLVLAAFTGQARDADEKVPGISVVHTWGDLLATTPVAPDGLPDGTILQRQKTLAAKQPPFRVQIGIDHDKVVAHGAVVLYCLTDHIFFSKTPGSYDGLGPFILDVQRTGASENPKSAVDAQMSLVGDDVNALLYAKSIRVADSGTYEIELRLPPPPGDKTGATRTIARIKISVTDDPTGPDLDPLPLWSPFGNAKAQEEKNNDSQSADEVSSVIVCNPAGGIALPATPFGGIPFSKLPAPERPLPSLFPAQPEPGLKLEMVKSSLEVTADHDISGYFPDDYFVARWWVNDKPWVPDPNTRGHRPLRELAAAEWIVRKFRFDLDFQPVRLAVKKGDKIGVQILYCPEGWEYALTASAQDEAQRLQEERAREPLNDTTTSFSFASNRVDFVYSGDPKAPLQQ